MGFVFQSDFSDGVKLAYPLLEGGKSGVFVLSSLLTFTSFEDVSGFGLLHIGEGGELGFDMLSGNFEFVERGEQIGFGFEFFVERLDVFKELIGTQRRHSLDMKGNKDFRLLFVDDFSLFAVGSVNVFEGFELFGELVIGESFLRGLALVGFLHLGGGIVYGFALCDFLIAIAVLS